MRNAALLLLLVTVAMAAPAGAQGGAQTGTETVVVGSGDRPTVQLRTRPDRPGDVYRFQSETEFVQTDDQGGQSQTNRQVYDIEVLGLEPDGGLRLRYTLREAEVKDSGGASMEAALKAAVGGSLEFRVARSGQVTGVDNWPAYRARMLERIDAALPETDRVRTLVHQRFAQPPLQAASEMVLGDIRLMGALEIQGAAPLGLTDLNAGRPGGGRATLDVSVLKPDCRVKVKRDTNRSMSGVTRALVSEAELVVSDGRIVALTERRVTRASAGSQTETIRIQRVSPTPAC